MECALAGLTNEKCLIYLNDLNDIIVFSSSFTTALTYLHGITSSTPTVDTVHYLEHVSATGVKPGT